MKLKKTKEFKVKWREVKSYFKFTKLNLSFLQ